MAGEKTNMYVNTMVFTIIAGLLSIMLLCFLLWGSQLANDYAVFIIAVELGLLAVIILAIYRIVVYERRMDKMNNNAIDNLLQVKSCPDYWTVQQSLDGKTVCKNQYKVGDVTYEETTDRKETKDSRGYVIPKKKQINLADFDRKSLGVICDEVNIQESPWTDVRMMCDIFNVPN